MNKNLQEHLFYWLARLVTSLRVWPSEHKDSGVGDKKVINLTRLGVI
jgi:hypothetical protein